MVKRKMSKELEEACQQAWDCVMEHGGFLKSAEEGACEKEIKKVLELSIKEGFVVRLNDIDPNKTLPEQKFSEIEWTEGEDAEVVFNRILRKQNRK